MDPTPEILADIVAIDAVETNWNSAHRGRYDVTYATETAADDPGLKASVQQWADSGGVVMNAGTTFSYNARRELEGSDFSVGTSRDFPSHRSSWASACARLLCPSPP